MWWWGGGGRGEGGFQAFEGKCALMPFCPPVGGGPVMATIFALGEWSWAETSATRSGEP